MKSLIKSHWIIEYLVDLLIFIGGLWLAYKSITELIEYIKRAFGS